MNQVLDQDAAQLALETKTHLLPLLYVRAALGIPTALVPPCEAAPPVVVRSPQLTGEWEALWLAELARTSAAQRGAGGNGGVPAWNSLAGVDRLGREGWRSWAAERIEDLSRRAMACLGIAADDPRRQELVADGVRRLVVVPFAEVWTHVGEGGTLVASIGAVEAGEVPSAR